MSSLLDRLALQPPQYAALPSDVCARVADFLLRWQAYGEALACLDALGPLSAVQLEQRAAALHGLGRTAEALALLDQRRQQHDSLPAAIQRIRLQAAAGQVQGALAAARAAGQSKLGIRPRRRCPSAIRSARLPCSWPTCSRPPATSTPPKPSTSS